MYGLKWKIDGRQRTTYFMSQQALNRFIGMLKLNSKNTDITIIPNDRRTIC